MTEQPSPPSVRAFTSYSWSSPTHEAWVIQLASRLREDGVDVILDKWDLKPGHDSYQFMESMVTDITVTKVMMICDRQYVEKANNRAGGVGTESQIISPELYGKGSQDKFAALMTDEDEDGNAHVPVFYKGRIYFDFRSADKFEASYEQLLRWLVDRPQHVKPKLGAVPSSILDAAPTASATQSRARRAAEAVRQGSTSAASLVRDYGDALRSELQSLAPQLSNAEPADETIIKAISSMRPYLQQWSDLVSTIVRFGQDERVWQRTLSINEQLGTLMYRDSSLSHWISVQFDAFKVIAHEAFLTTVALALDEERFDLVQAAVEKAYLLEERDTGGRRATQDFTAFRQHAASLDQRKTRLQLRRISLEADLLREAHPIGAIPSFESLMQADFFLYICSAGQSTSNNWYPYSLVYAADRYSPFPVFARAESMAYFQRLAPALGVTSVDTLKTRLEAISSQSGRIFDYRGLPIAYLANAENLGVVR
ncbi:hypothetical protein CA606_19095 [Caulobacter vibrioides]|uniref:SEFIR domain-containing protein n=1 Tax=Caulobacter vibrioides TaxID=155892 RepID=A0A290MWK1_CAUVI|nr:toll/interleukin-1 receptor domain-containing protein [Caulobacter vibrioides]ATC34273.1 hypothetical protein CA606_19095 [Caulobacter vibrioides]